ncbi:recombinase family protein [Vibrio artabrorum]|uniref:Recombinase family protein n=1 Tax=Vibrio artabrorum TaxID=446374 RepID=A0ABT8CHW8_9VIBR|nr:MULTISPECIES: recombinase family protein [Vibrio]MDN3701317.1 recombinase family protein [Vibrio artabrorum]TKF49201.1 recombinase family protein [Vibrio lentus]
MKIAYVRVSTVDQSLESQVKAIHNKFGTDVKIVEEYGVSGTINGSERPELSKLLGDVTGLRKGDELIMWWFDRLGRNYHDAREMSQMLLKRGVVLKTVNQELVLQYTGKATEDMLVDVQLTLLAGIAENERQARLASAQAGRDKLSDDEWKEKFQGRKKNVQLHQQVIDELCADNPLSLRKIAKKLGCGVSSVQRIKKAMQGS